MTMAFFKHFAGYSLISLSACLHLFRQSWFFIVNICWYTSHLLYMIGPNLALIASLPLSSVLFQAVPPYQPSAEEALWLTFDKFAELVHLKLVEKQVTLVDVKGHPLSELNFIQSQWDAKVARRMNDMCEERLIVCMDHLSRMAWDYVRRIRLL